MLSSFDTPCQNELRSLYQIVRKAMKNSVNNTICTCDNQHLFNSGTTCELCMQPCMAPSEEGHELPHSTFTLDYFEELDAIEAEMKQVKTAA